MKLPLIICIALVVFDEGFAAKGTLYEKVLTPLELYSVPESVSQVLNKSQLFKMVMDKGLPIKTARENLAVAKEYYALTEDGYFPAPTLSSSYKYSESGDSTSLITKSQSASLGLQIVGKSTWGFQYIVELPSVAHSLTGLTQNGTASNRFSLGVGLTVDLLQNSFFFLGKTPLRIADNSMSAAKQSLRSTVLSTLLSAEEAFYDVLLKQLKVKVLEYSLQSVKALLDDVKEMFRTGESDRLSIVKVELQVAQTENTLLSARTELENALQTLRGILALDDKNKTEVYPNPMEIKDMPKIPDLDTAEQIEKAKKNRPDYINVLLEQKSSGLSVESAYSNILPNLELVTGYSYSGTSSVLSDAISDGTDFKDPGYYVGFQLSYPLFNDANRKNYRIAKINQIKADLAVKQLDIQIAKEVTSAVNTVQLQAERQKISELAKNLSEKKLDAEFERFKVGESAIRNILDYQNEVNESRISGISARVDLMNSIARLKSYVGDFPEGVEFNYD